MSLEITGAWVGEIASNDPGLDAGAGEDDWPGAAPDGWHAANHNDIVTLVAKATYEKRLDSFGIEISDALVVSG